MSVSTTTSCALVSCDGVTVVHGHGEAAVRALVGVRLKIRAGESLALLGPSGSGKTTLLHVLGGLISPDSGTISWRGEELTSLERAARGRGPAQGIAFVFQGANLLPHLDAAENIAFAILATGGSGREPHRAGNGTGTPETPEEFLRLVGLEGKAHALPADLSGGEQQRVAIARALAQGPELLLCDEPTGHLDSDTGVRVLDLVEAVRGMLGFAMVVATHDPGVASRADRTIELADGVLSAQGAA
jgi:putative ABC transport system ATP-binding protein